MPGEEAAAADRRAVDAVVIRPFASRAEDDACVRLQREVWGGDFVDVVPATILMVARRTGGVAAGAFAQDGRLLGFVFGISGLCDGEPIHWSDMLAVRPEARGAGLGARLKLHQRDELRTRGIRRMRWSYDPLVTRNANLNLHRLGAMPVEYVPDMYGDTRSRLHAGLATDRFVVEWRLDAPGPAGAGTGAGAEPSAAARRPATNAPSPAHAPPAVDAPMVDAASDPDRLPTADLVRVAAPADIAAIVATDPARARAWRDMHRRAFTWYFARGYRVIDFVHRPPPADAWYVVSRARPGTRP